MGRITAGIMTLGVKIITKLLPIAAKLAKFAKIGKFSLAVISAASYAYFFTWQFAFILMFSLFFHESGHIYAMKKCGMKTKGIYFLPFMGALSVVSEDIKSRRDEVYIAAMGPIWGFLLAMATFSIYMFTKNNLYAAIAGWMALINLFNLLPINPLDGGRIMKSIAFSINSDFGLMFLAMGIAISISLLFMAKIMLFLVLLILGSLELIFELSMHRKHKKLKESLDEIKPIINDKKVEIKSNEMKNIEISFEKIEKRIEEIILPSLSKKGIIISSVIYIIIISVLLALLTYANNVPEVDLARKFFMS